MIWLTWRQQRLETMIGGGIVALVLIFLLKTGSDMASAYRHTGISACIARDASPGACQNLANAFQTRFASVTNIITWLNFLPLVLGVLLAAPLVLDLEQGTHRLAWTQSATRQQWLTVKLVFIVGASTVAALGLMAIMTWWNTPLVHLGSRLNRGQFDFEGIVPVAYTVFAAALCLAAGSLLRRAVPAIGITLAGYLAARVSIETFVGYSYLPPVTKHVPFGSTPGDPSPPTRADFFINATASIPKEVMRTCFGHTLQPPPPGTAAAHEVASCFGQHGVFASVVYQPAGRFWLFQAVESAIFLVPAVVLLALAVWLIRYRVT